MSSLALVITIAHFTSAEGGAATAVPSSARLGAREDDDWKDLMVFGSLMCFRWRAKGTYLTKYVEVSPKKAFDCLSMFLFILWDQKCCNVTNIKYAMHIERKLP